MKDNITDKSDKLSTSHVVCDVQHPRGDSTLPNASFIGETQNEILTRMNQHRQNGAILERLLITILRSYHKMNCPLMSKFLK